MMTVTNLRNAIVHGGGVVTLQQSRDIAKLIDLEHRLRNELHVELANRRVVLGDRCLVAVADACFKYVSKLDESLRDQSISVRTRSLY